jgi:hypothetical protein
LKSCCVETKNKTPNIPKPDTTKKFSRPFSSFPLSYIRHLPTKSPIDAGVATPRALKERRNGNSRNVFASWKAQPQGGMYQMFSFFSFEIFLHQQMYYFCRIK